MADTVKSSDVTSVHGLVVLNPDGSAVGAPVGGATAANQTDGSQKTQIVDAGGEVATVTSGKLDVNASIDTTGLATSALQTTGNTSLSSIDTKTPALGQALAAASTPVVLTAAQVATLTPLSTVAATQSGTWTVQPGNTANTTAWKVDGSAVTQPVSGTVTANATLAAETTKVIGTVNIAAAQTLSTVTTVGAVTGITNALPAGTNAIGKLAANSGVDIGDVDVTSLTGGTIAHDSADSGNPLKVGGRAINAEITAVANNDRSDFVTDLTGKQIVLPYANPENFVSGAITTAMTGTTSTSLIAAPAVGLRNYITTIIVSNAHASVGTDVVIQDGSGGTTLMTIPAAAVYGGAVINLPVPLRQPTTATAIFCANVTTGASTKVSAVGYKGA